jgi:hypothetical protein
MRDKALTPGQSTEPTVVRAPPELLDRGRFMALLTFRPLDGSELQSIAGFADTADYARAEVYGVMRAALGQVQTLAPDTPAVRAFIHAASHMHDLRQALGALEAAEASGDTSVAGHLRVHAVVAYGRTYGSRARPDLSAFVEPSDEDAALTRRLKITRNKYGAHSENGMTITTPLLDLQRELDGRITIQQVTGVTVDAPMPVPFIAGFAAMLHRLIEQLTAALQPLKRSIQEGLTPDQVSAAFNDPQPLQFVVAHVAEWEPDGQRPAYPASRFSKVHIDGGVTATLAR